MEEQYTWAAADGAASPDGLMALPDEGACAGTPAEVLITIETCSDLWMDSYEKPDATLNIVMCLEMRPQTVQRLLYAAEERWKQAEASRWESNMLSAAFILSLFCHVSGGLYREWLPNTNFNNASNWDKGKGPCKNNRILFSRDQELSVFLQTPIDVMEMYMPLDGEFILGHGASLAASDGRSLPGCQTGEVTFKDPDRHNWYDPKNWQTRSSVLEVPQDQHAFTLDEERVPCQHDDVAFQPATSFRVNLDSDAQNIHVKTISLMNRRFASSEDFLVYKESNTGRLQFHGNGSVSVTNTECDDRSGCHCGNSRNLGRICVNLLRGFGDRCMELDCANPLKPQGHCCEICGAIIYLKYDQKFNLELYKERLINSFLGLDDYKDVRISLTKVHTEHVSRAALSSDALACIQIVLIDGASSGATGTSAARLAEDIVADIARQGDVFGIVGAEVQMSTSVEEPVGGNVGVGTVAGIVLGVLLAASVTASLVAAFISARIRVRIPSAFVSLKNDFNCSTADNVDRGFTNPVFDPQVNLSLDLCRPFTGEDAINIVPSRLGTDTTNVLFDPPGFGEQEC
ncbi:protein amnionless [Rhinoraja longicauda]